MKIIVTPTQAQEWLDTINIGNRKVSKSQIKSYASMMTNGEWKYNPLEPIGFNTQMKKLVNGQHRLRAVVEAGVPVTFEVIEAEDETLFEVLDSGRKRSVGDVLEIKGLSQDPNVLAAVAAQAIDGFTGARTHRRAQIVEFVNNNLVAIQGVLPIATTKNLRSPVAGAFLKAKLLGMKNIEEAQTRLIDMTSKGNDDPIPFLNRALLTNERGKGRPMTAYKLTVTVLRAVHTEKPLKSKLHVASTDLSEDDVTKKK